MDKLKKTIIYLIVILLNISTSFAQMKKMENVNSFVKKMEQTASSINSIESNLKQTKHINAFKQNLVSLGKFYYKEDKISLHYTMPRPYLVVINNGKIKIESAGKKNIMDLKDNKEMQEMNNMLKVGMTGNLSNVSKDYLLEFFEDDQYYMVNVKPVNESAKKYMLDIYFNKKDMSVDKMRMSENGGDYTEYQFLNKKLNTLKNDDLFKI